ncbi:MAG: S8 family serine peptidase [Gammaproteobacteria bacterium]|nr:S8 family serine peptidase [Gammaproteobacteria bacterium]
MDLTKRLLLALKRIGLFAVFSLVLSGPAHAGEQSKVFNRAALNAEIQSQGRVRVIIGLSENQDNGASRVRPRRERMSPPEIRSLQERVLRRLGRMDKWRHRFQRIPFATMEVDAEQLDELLADSEVSSVQVDRPIRLALASTAPLIGADIAHENGFSGAGQAVAILDTGVDREHPFLARDGVSKVIAEACYSSNRSTNGYTVSTFCPNQTESQTGVGSGVNCPPGIRNCFHGTHVAGIAAGNGIGAAPGVAKDADILSIQVFSHFKDKASCTGSTCYCGSAGSQAECVAAFTSDIIAGLERVLELSDSISIASANLSLGQGRYYSAVDCDAVSIGQKTVIDALRDAGVATVIASGNNGYDNGFSHPGCISSAVSVGSMDDSRSVSSFTSSGSWLSFLAPGRSVYSSMPGGGFKSKNGTSMATPQVSGAIAVLKASQPQATIDEILSALMATSVPIYHVANDLTLPLIAIADDDGASVSALESLTDPANLPSELVMDDDYSGEDVSGSPDSFEDSEAYRGRARYLDSDGHNYQFQPVITRAGQYRAFAWWVADSSHSTEAVFRITDDQGARELVVDQTTAGNRWNELGMFDFSLGSTSRIEILGSSNAPVVADAIRLQRVQVMPDPEIFLTLVQPSQSSYTSGEAIEISWIDNADTDSLQIALYYDDDGLNTDGTLIVEGIALGPDGESDRFTWDTAPVPDGIYHVYGLVTHASGDVSSYAPAAIAIDRGRTDSDTDGVPDLWEWLRYGGLNSDGRGDNDSDGSPDFVEFESQTDPDIPDVRLPLQAGLNMIGIPVSLEPARDSLALAAELTPELDSIQRLDSATQTTQAVRVVGGDPQGVSFPIATNEGLLINLTVPREIVLTGTPATAAVDLNQGSNLVGFHTIPENMDAYGLLQQIGEAGTVASVRRYNTHSGRYESAFWAGTLPRGVNFPLRRGEGYLIDMHQSVNGFTLQ